MLFTEVQWVYSCYWYAFWLVCELLWLNKSRAANALRVKGSLKRALKDQRTYGTVNFFILP